MQNTAFEVEEKQPNAIFPTQFYKLELGVIVNMESWENDFEYEYALKSFSYLYSLLMLTSSNVPLGAPKTVVQESDLGGL